jgi:hypothetical protein
MSGVIMAIAQQSGGSAYLFSLKIALASSLLIAGESVGDVVVVVVAASVSVGTVVLEVATMVAA